MREKKDFITLLSSTQLLDPLLFVVSTIERDADTHARIILHRPLRLLLLLPPLSFFIVFIVTVVIIILVLGVRFIVRWGRTIHLTLNDQSTTTGRDETLKDVRKLARHLFEGPFDGLVFTLIEDIDEFDDGRLGRIQFASSLDERVPLFGEVVILFKGLLVHVSILF